MLYFNDLKLCKKNILPTIICVWHYLIYINVLVIVIVLNNFAAGMSTIETCLSY